MITNGINNGKFVNLTVKTVLSNDKILEESKQLIVNGLLVIGVGFYLLHLNRKKLEKKNRMIIECMVQ